MTKCYINSPYISFEQSAVWSSCVPAVPSTVKRPLTHVYHIFWPKQIVKLRQRVRQLQFPILDITCCQGRVLLLLCVLLAGVWAQDEAAADGGEGGEGEAGAAGAEEMCDDGDGTDEAWVYIDFLKNKIG